MLTITVNEREAVCRRVGPITAGSVGLPVRFCFSAAWEGLSRVAVFRGSGASADVALLDDACTVPAEVLATAGGSLTVGVWGGDAAGTVVIPTVWVRAGRIEEGTEPSGIEPAAPTPSWAAQVQAAAAAALAKATAVETAANNGGFDGADGLSPTLAVSDIPGGHRVTVTDAEGARSFDVLDGADGQDGGGELFVVEAAASPYTGYTEAIAAVNAGKHLVLHAVLGMAGNRKEYWLTDYTVGTNSITFYVPDNACLEHSYILETDGTDDTAVEAYTDWQDSITANGWKPVASRAIYAALALKADAADLHNTAEVTVSSAGAVTQELEINTLYHFTGALTALTITFGAYASGRIEQYHFDFDSGSTAPTLTLPNTVTMPDGFTVEANTHYEIDILNGYGVVSAWATS